MGQKAGTRLSQNFNVTVHEVSEDYLVVTFENTDTGEVLKMDSRQVQAAPIPIMVYIVGAAALRATIVFVRAAKSSKAVRALKNEVEILLLDSQTVIIVGASGERYVNRILFS